MVTVPFALCTQPKHFNAENFDTMEFLLRFVLFISVKANQHTHTIGHVFVFNVVDNSTEIYAVIFLGLNTQCVTVCRCIMNISGI